MRSLNLKGQESAKIKETVRQLSDVEKELEDRISSRNIAKPGLYPSVRRLLIELKRNQDIYDKFQGRSQVKQMLFSAPHTGQIPAADFDVITLPNGTIIPIKSLDSKFHIIPGNESLVFFQDGTDLSYGDDGLPFIYRDNNIVFIDSQTGNAYPVTPIK